jgi:hypothetical protein
MKLKLKGRQFDTIEGIQGEWQRVLDSVTERAYRKGSQMGGTVGVVCTGGGDCLEGDGGTGVYMGRGLLGG